MGYYKWKEARDSVPEQFIKEYIKNNPKFDDAAHCDGDWWIVLKAYIEHQDARIKELEKKIRNLKVMAAIYEESDQFLGC